MPSLVHLFTSLPVVQAAVGIAILACLITVLRALQRRAIPPLDWHKENEYLSGLEKHLLSLHRANEFEPSYFVDREYRIEYRYEPRSFFLAKHKNVLSRLPLSETDASAEQRSEGHYTDDISGVAVARGEPIIILGEPGSGKSVSARELALSIAKRSLKDRRLDRLIPIFVTLNEYTAIDSKGKPLSFSAFLNSVLANRGDSATFSTDFVKDRLNEYLDAGRVFLVLDSLDEMPPATFRARCEQITTFALRFSSNSFVVTCRAQDFSGGIRGVEAHLDRLKKKEIVNLIQRRHSSLRGQSVRSMYASLTSEGFVLRSLVDNPFYLNLLLHFYSLKGMLPENYVALFQVICHNWAEREVRKDLAWRSRGGLIPAQDFLDEGRAVERLVTGLSAIAFALSNSAGFGTFATLEDIRNECLKLGTPEDTIDLALLRAGKGGMLYRHSDGQKVRFVHHKFQEYFAAEHLSRSLGRSLVPYEALPTICRNIWWEEVTTILAGIGARPDEIVRVLCDNEFERYANVSFAGLKDPYSWELGGYDSSYYDYTVDGADPVEASADNVVVDGNDGTAEESSEDVLYGEPTSTVPDLSTDLHSEGVIVQRVLWLCGRCLRLLPPDSPNREALLIRVLDRADQQLATSNTPLGRRIDAIRSLGELEDPRAVGMLIHALADKSALIRELAFSSLAGLTLGREYLKPNVGWVAFQAYFNHSFLSQLGGLRTKEWSRAFPDRLSRLIIYFWAAASYAVRSFNILILLALSYMLLPALGPSVYALILIGALLWLDVLSFVYSRRVLRLAEQLRAAFLRIVVVCSISTAAYAGLFAPPWLVLPTYVGLLCVYIALRLLLLWHADERQRRALAGGLGKRSFVQFIKEAASGIVEGLPKRAQEEANLGMDFFESPEQAVARMGASQLRALATRLESGDVGGLEVELFEALKKRERQLLQEVTSPTILDLSAVEEAETLAATESGRRSASVNRVEILMCYSHHDAAMRDQLEKHLRPLEREGLIRCWYDRQITAGRDLDENIEAHLRTAPIIMLLISVDFLASNYCYTREAEIAMQRHEAGEARVIPVIGRPCDWLNTPLAKLKALPEDGRPIVAWDDTDAAYLNVVQQIRVALSELSGSC